MTMTLSLSGAGLSAWSRILVFLPLASALCDLETVEPSVINRSMLLARRAPLLIRGAASDWPAQQKWDFAALRAAHQHEVFWADPWNANISLGDVLDQPNQYWMGHVLPEGDCYDSKVRPFTPLLDRLADDFTIPEWGVPMTTFQIGLGRGTGIGLG